MLDSAVISKLDTELLANGEITLSRAVALVMSSGLSEKIATAEVKSLLAIWTKKGKIKRRRSAALVPLWYVS